MTDDPTPNMTAIAGSLERIAATLMRWAEEDRQWIAEIDEKLGRLAQVVQEHEERLAS